IRSLGRDVRIDDVELSEPTVHLVRRPNGTWSHKQVVDAFTTPAEGHPEGSALEISGLDVSEGKVVVLDRSRGKAATTASAIALQNIDVKARNLFQDTATLRVDAALGPTKSKHNVRADLKLAPAPRGHVTLSSIAFATFRGFLPEGIDSIVRQGNVSMEGDV